ncbi:RNA-directed DNA polymerase from mobile element jockey, partial [Plakobranchus ocellatus]
MVISSKGSAKVADRSPFKIHRELKSILGDETIEVTKLGSGDLMVELKSKDQAKKLGAIATYLDIPVTVSPHKSLNSSKGECRLGKGQVPPRGYTLLLPQGGSPGGEAALLIRNGTRFSEIDLKTGLHAAAATISLEKTLTVCSLYLPPNSPVLKLSLAELFEQLPKPFLVLGDFNAHSPAWGNSRRDGRGRMLEEFIAENDFIILSSGEQTFVHSAYHSTSAIDLAVASPSIAAECSWAAHSDLCGSDHFPIFLTLSSNFSSNENGVPQGSILSPMLFNLKINNIINYVSKHVNSSIFVDDFAIYAEGKHLQHLERTIQMCINNVQKWVSENGFRFSVSKTTCVHFHRQRIYTEPALHLDGQQIPVKGEAKFLGVIFDQKLTFENNVKYLKNKCLKALNLLRVVGHTDWGADRATLLKLYRTLVRSKLDFGSVIYGSAKKHVLRALDPIHHQGLRIALGAFRTSPIKSLYAEAGEPSLEHRRMKLAFTYVLKLKSLPRNPCHEVVFEAPLTDFSAVT